MLARIRMSKENKDQGFTLIELLVVVVIIGILAAIAIPTFLNQREKAWERAALSDLRNAGVKFEEYFSDKGVYPTKAELKDQYAIKVSESVTVGNVTGGGSTTGYCLEVAHAKLTDADDKFILNSTDGVAKKGTAVC